MIGRAAIGYPWIFREIKHFIATGKVLPEPTMNERISIVKRHLEFSCEWKEEKTGILEMRKHYANYFKGIQNFKPFRRQLVTLDNKDDLLHLLSEIEEEYQKA